MASTNKTTNYELSQFIETDRPAWLTDYNGDMRKIDTELKAVSDVANGASGSVSSLTDRMTAAEGAISTNANDIDALEARADVLEAQAQSTAGTIAGIQTEQTAQNLGIEAATELGYNLARPYDSASTYTVGSYVLFQNTLYKCVTAVATGEAFDPTKWLAIKATDEIAAGGETLEIINLANVPLNFIGNMGLIVSEGLYTGNNYTVTTLSPANVTCAFTPNSIYIKKGKLRQLFATIDFSFDPVQRDPFKTYTFQAIFEKPSVIDLDGSKVSPGYKRSYTDHSYSGYSNYCFSLERANNVDRIVAKSTMYSAQSISVTRIFFNVDLLTLIE